MKTRTSSKSRSNFVAAKSHIKLTTAEVIKMLRELKGWTQADLSRRSKIKTSNISALENGHIELGKRRAEQLAKAFKVHPAIIMFPEYETDEVLRVA